MHVSHIYLNGSMQAKYSMNECTLFYKVKKKTVRKKVIPRKNYGFNTYIAFFNYNTAEIHVYGHTNTQIQIISLDKTKKYLRKW